MLVLSRKKGQELVIGDNIRIYVSRVSGNRVTLGIDAPEGVTVVRSELLEIVNSFGSGPTSELETHNDEFAVETDGPASNATAVGAMDAWHAATLK